MKASKPLLLIVDDDDEIRAQLRWSLNSEYEILQAGDRSGALAQVKEKEPSVVLLDLGLPPRPNQVDEGMAALEAILQAQPRTKVIIVSGQNERVNALEAIGRGAYDFMNKPVDTDELRLVLKRCFHVAKLEQDFLRMQQALPSETFEGMLGNSEAMQRAFALIRKVAPSDAPVMLLGESGTGKEMAAAAIHARSNRAAGPFVAINCSAIPEALLESELFGHEKGSFTGADNSRIGKIEQAAGGTLFLDEIGEAPLNVQVKLLRFLQDRIIERVGGRQSIPVDARIVAATNADLSEGMKAGTFREDFYFRLAVVEIVLPPLREREGDIDFLATSFLRRFSSERGSASIEFSAAALNAIRVYGWPGNVRELQNRVRRAAIMCDDNRILPEDLQIPVTEQQKLNGSSLKDARDALEKQMAEAALRKHKGKITAAAADLGISRPTFYELMEKHQIEKP